MTPVIEAKVAELVEGAQAEIDRVQAMGGAIAAVEYMKQELVSSHARRRAHLGATPDRDQQGQSGPAEKPEKAGEPDHAEVVEEAGALPPVEARQQAIIEVLARKSADEDVAATAVIGREETLLGRTAR